MTSPEWTEVLRKRLAAIGVEVRVQTFTGDSSYPTEFTLIAGSVRTFGEPTLDAALVSLIAELLKVAGQEPILRGCEFCGGAHYTGQRCPLSPS